MRLIIKGLGGVYLVGIYGPTTHPLNILPRQWNDEEFAVITHHLQRNWKEGHDRIRWRWKGIDKLVQATSSILLQKCQESSHPFASVAAGFSTNLLELTSEKFSWHLIGCHVVQAVEQGFNCFWQVPCVCPEPWNTGPWQVQPIHSHTLYAAACPICVRQLSSSIMASPKCSTKVGVWLITPEWPWNTCHDKTQHETSIARFK